MEGKMQRGKSEAQRPKPSQGDAAFCLGLRYGMAPKVISKWGQKHGHDLIDFLNIPPASEYASLFVACVLADNPYEGILFARLAPWIDPERKLIFGNYPTVKE
jgi:hypothetical protein